MFAESTSRLPKGLERKFTIAGSVIIKHPITCAPGGVKGDSSYLLSLALIAALGYLSIIAQEKVFVRYHYGLYITYVPIVKDIHSDGHKFK